MQPQAGSRSAAALPGEQGLPLAAGALLLLGLAAGVSGNGGGGDRGELHVVEAPGLLSVRGGVGRLCPDVGGGGSGVASGGSMHREAGVGVLLVAADVWEPEGVGQER